ncbi:MAG: hypothetical protein KF764_30835 [Labilithrix sp.]|nr:hypothetical protein [Labilithrix sp.]
MAIDLTLEHTDASGRLLPARFAEVLVHLVKTSFRTSTRAPRGVMHGQQLRLALDLALNDPACAAFLLDFAGQGLRVTGTARGPSAALLTWAFHALAGPLKCTLFDAREGCGVDVAPEAHRAAAVAYLASYEAGVRALRAKPVDDEGMVFLAWLAREEQLALSEDDPAAVDALGAALPMDDAPGLYEMLLESAAVDDVFVSERELASLLGRFNAWLASPVG